MSSLFPIFPNPLRSELPRGDYGEETFNRKSATHLPITFEMKIHYEISAHNREPFRGDTGHRETPGPKTHTTINFECCRYLPLCGFYGIDSIEKYLCAHMYSFPGRLQE